jgi:hypothetical protein
MKSFLSYITESKTRIRSLLSYILENQSCVLKLEEKEIKSGALITYEPERSPWLDKFFKGNKGNCVLIKFKTTDKTKIKGSSLMNVEFEEIGQVDDVFKGNCDKYVDSDILSKLNCVSFERDGDHINVFACVADNRGTRDTNEEYFGIPFKQDMINSGNNKLNEIGIIVK